MDIVQANTVAYLWNTTRVHKCSPQRTYAFQDRPQVYYGFKPSFTGFTNNSFSWTVKQNRFSRSAHWNSV